MKGLMLGFPARSLIWEKSEEYGMVSHEAQVVLFNCIFIGHITERKVIVLLPGSNPAGYHGRLQVECWW
jgi:hypothetical protein